MSRSSVSGSAERRRRERHITAGARTHANVQNFRILTTFVRVTGLLFQKRNCVDGSSQNQLGALCVRRRESNEWKNFLMTLFPILICLIFYLFFPLYIFPSFLFLRKRILANGQDFFCSFFFIRQITTDPLPFDWPRRQAMTVNRRRGDVNVVDGINAVLRLMRR